MRVYCGLACTGQRIPVAVVDSAGRLVASHEVSDTPSGYAALFSLLAEGCTDTGQVRAAMATDSETALVPLLLAATGEPLAVGDPATINQFMRDEPPGTPEPYLRALALARALQSGMLPATTQPAPRDLAVLRPVLTAHRAAVAGRVAALAMLRELLRELYPAALRAFSDPGTPLALAVLERLAEPAEVSGTRDRDLLKPLCAAGYPETEAEAAIRALRRAVGETSTRGAVSNAVGPTVRNGIAAVRAAEAAAAGLVQVITERVEPRTSGRGFPAVPPVSGIPASAPPESGPPVSGPPVSAIPASGLPVSTPPAIPVPVAEFATSEHPQTTYRRPGAQPVMAEGPPMPAGFAPPSAGPAPSTALSQASPAGTRQSRRRPPVVPPPAPQVPQQPATGFPEPPTGGYPGVGPDGTNAFPTGNPTSGFPTAGFPANGTRNLNGATPSGTGNSVRYSERGPLPPSAGTLAPPSGSVAPDQSDEELSLLSPEELQNGPGAGRRSTEPGARYMDPVSGQLGALIEFPRYPRRPGAAQPDTSYREPGRREDQSAPATQEPRHPAPPRQRPGDAPTSSPPLGDTDGDLLIFAQAHSAWFSGNEDESGEPEWRTEADEGWDAAAAASHPTVGGTTRSGLPRRVPSANLVPGAAPNRELTPVHPISRDAAQLAAHTAGYFRGWNQARQDAEEPPYPSARHR